MSRIWSDQTPKWSPGFVTPVRPKSPDGRKFWPAHISPNKVCNFLKTVLYKNVAFVLHNLDKRLLFRSNVKSNLAFVQF